MDIYILKILFKKIITTFQGYHYWNKLERKYILSKSSVILLPNKDEIMYKYIFLYLDKFLERNRKESAIFLAMDCTLAEHYSSYSKKVLDIVPISDNTSNMLLEYYCLPNRNMPLIVASFEQPLGRRFENIKDSGKISCEELVAIGIYRLFPFVPISLHANT